MLATDVLQHQGIVADDLTTSWYQDRVKFLLGSSLDVDKNTYGDVISDHQLEREKVRMRAAHSFHVNSDMSNLIVDAGHQLFSQDAFTLTFHPWELPTEMGFVMFDKNISEITDVSKHDENPFTVAGMSWGPGGDMVVPTKEDSNATNWLLKKGFVVGQRIPSLSMTLYVWLDQHAQWMLDECRKDAAKSRRVAVEARDKMQEFFTSSGFVGVCQAMGVSPQELDGVVSDPNKLDSVIKAVKGPAFDSLPAETVEWFRQSTNEIKLISHTYSQSAQQIEDIERFINAEYLVNAPHKLIPAISFAWPQNGVTIDRSDFAGTSDSQQSTISSATLAWTFFHMSMQTIASRESVKVPRAMGKRWRKMEMPKLVTVVQLRRKSSPTDHPGESNVDWQHRWIVRGHWRMAACGVGRTERRPTWVAAYVKGPDDKPLMQTNKVYDLIR